MNRIRDLRRIHNIKQADLAAAMKVSTAALSGYETEKYQADISTYKRIAEYFGVTLDYLLGNDTVGSPGTRIPVLGSVPAGIPMEAIQDIIDWEEIPAAMCAGGQEYFALQVRGDSMWPDFLPGDTVILRKTPTCESGDVCVVYVNGDDATLKEVRLHEDGSLSIMPRNQSYPPRTFTPKEIRSLPVSIAGVVVELRRRINGR